ncbi:MAG: GNAT family N-acetyltransferase [Crocinitomicaceae bacterium]|nr:GNAT family N-acetyltransferase [Crocinitomicaceae bacterium]
MQFNHIKTNRLILREISQPVMDFVYGNYSDSGLSQFFGYNFDQLKVEREKHEKGFSTFNMTFLYFQLIDKESEKIIGWCGYHTWYLDHARAEIGYGITDKEFREKGLMSEALNAIIAYGFKDMKLNRIEAMAAEYNIASIKSLEKFKFVREGVLKGHYWENEQYEDSTIFGLLKDNYQG